ncbi:hypothetical protein C488_06690 [Natrinema pellirubrum DSM 15624]|uniref:DUF192 domain-containing protein n=1 Tax=Natrinema pellirubrum (strain DSM 15624 / CIP 106293 / JCM 10476 / NCIMB 786 / 157) TaxID=797303 RepID=L0JMS0_NATP1|nr:DUF192 domain-containing protein [Natrinema pellirubrum]AGB31867.1 hypothetical protein Natpe_2038 [Natrinema pellirubrum DSM 15624]ELY77786.1 hypothetical protein C488_06690 [Natrinema pellirubrum DSM 15624]
MRLVHEPASDADDEIVEERTETLATTVEVADTLVSQARGLMFRRSVPDDYALAFRFDDPAVRDLHMLFVFFPIDALWIEDGVVQRVERLRPWRSFARARADLIVELPAGSAAGVEAGDRVRLEDAGPESGTGGFKTP